eukprot:gnl/TRDRNA2_/TRDRNA2_198838_c0_seq1.p1 gnl/TRDRNA2_/TRDRNA2_198838_c0~~gnl/TRDRNA2_/TRDRNA2_198838_c0_seq1.p1  ORF type:complete len:339 (-),score=41.13 gnl/TRDRNA2_/TRDRNA2_198838_c0_seq1:73-1089(-)
MARTDQGRENAGASPVCRFCFEEGHETPDEGASESTRLVSPCDCRGTSMLVHLGCLRRWQESLCGNCPSPEDLHRATHCSVCRGRLKVDGRELEPDRALTAEDLARVLGNRSTFHPGSSWLLEGSEHIALSPVSAGSLLVAADGMQDPDFKRSVLLMYEPTRGVDLTRLLQEDGDPVKEVVHAAFPSTDGVKARVHHGGPMLREQPCIYYIVTTHQASSALEILAPSDAAPGLYFHGPTVEVPAVQAVRAARERLRSSSLGRDVVLVFRGCASWGEEQLSEELARGDWATCAVEAADLLETAPAELHSRICTSGRLRFQHVAARQLERKFVASSCVCQ